MSNESGVSAHIQSIRSVSHDKDPDGVCSAAIVCRYAKRKGLSYSVTLCDYGDLAETFAALATLRNTLLVVTDLGVDARSLPAVLEALRRASSQGCMVAWFDHHQWPEKSIRGLLGLEKKPLLKLRQDMCAAEITHRVLMPDDEISRELASVARDSDFNIREFASSSALADVISLLRFAALESKQDTTTVLTPLLQVLSDGGVAAVWDQTRMRLRDDLLEKRVQNYRRERNKKMRKALLGHQDLEIHGRLVRVVELPVGVTTTDMGVFASDPANLDLDGHRLSPADLLVTISPGGTLGFRRAKDNVLCNEAARLFNGGGHPYAAGGEYGMYSDFVAASTDIFSVLSQSKSWVVESPPHAETDGTDPQ
ncbi:MAG: DHH family phosphoesterase [Candidatus Thorarchaeota archaeon]